MKNWMSEPQMTDCLLTLEFSYGIQKSWIRKYTVSPWKSYLKTFGIKEAGSYAALHTYTYTHLDLIGWENISISWLLSSWTQSHKHFTHISKDRMCCWTLAHLCFLIQIQTQISLYTHSDTLQTRSNEKNNFNFTSARTQMYRVE